MDYIFITFIIIIIASVLFPISNLEKFEVKRSRRKGSPVQLGFLQNTPKPIQKLMGFLNKIGMQMDADKEYDTVATDYLDKDKIN